MSKSSAAEQLDGAIFVPPAPLESFPSDAWAALQHPHMRQGAPRQMPKDSPPWAFLDNTENIDANCAAVTRAANEVFHQPWGPKEARTRITVGAPGIYGFYLPSYLEFLAPLAAKAAGVAALTGELGANPIQLQVARYYRPMDDTAWHTDEAATLLICADYAGTALALTGAKLDLRKLRGYSKLPKNARIMSVRAGVPIAFNQIIHSGPFEYPAISHKKMEETCGFHNTILFNTKYKDAYYHASWCSLLQNRLQPEPAAYR